MNETQKTSCYVFFNISGGVFKYVNVVNVPVFESTDDPTLVNDLYFFSSSEERRPVHVLVKKQKGKGNTILFA